MLEKTNIYNLLVIYLSMIDFGKGLVGRVRERYGKFSRRDRCDSKSKKRAIKVLLLPHCLVDEQRRELKRAAEEKGYIVYDDIKGGSMAKKRLYALVEKYEALDTIVGVACQPELEMGYRNTKKLKKGGTMIRGVRLLKDGCKDTKVNLEEALQALAIEPKPVKLSYYFSRIFNFLRRELL